MSIQITITDAGRAEIINAANTGTAPVTITQVGLGSGQYTPTAGQTALQTEIKRLSTIAGEIVADDTIHVTIKDESNDAYNVSEFGLFTDSGTLFAVYSQSSGPFVQKAAASTLLLAVDVILGTLDATNITPGKVLADDQMEALEMIVHKIGRIVNGDPDYFDSWIDVAGYAQLVADRLMGNAR
jgi:hypothetical protein